MGEENEMLEFKTSTAEIPAALDSIVAILNKHQKGTIYFGVKDNGKPIGQQMGKNTLTDVTRAITDNIEPRIYPIVEKVILEGKECIKVEFEGDDIPYFSYGRAYIRVGEEDKKITQKELKKLILKASKNDTKWENEVTNYSYEDIDEDILKKCIDQGNESKRINYEYTNKRDILNRLGLINDKGYLINAGNALFGKNANIVLKMAIFATDTKDTFIDITRKVGNIISLSKLGETYVKEHMRWTVNLKSGRLERLEIPEIPVDSVREAIMNCLCHQSMVSNQEAEISIYKNRIEIYNPGTFPEEYTPEDFIEGKGKSILRNKLIAQTLFLSHEIEAFGTGIRRIYEECKKNNVKVEFKQDELGFLVVFYRKTEKELEDVASEIPITNIKMDIKLNKTEKKIIEILKNETNITQQELSDKIGVSKRSIINAMNSLKSKEIIKRVGTNKNGFWKIDV